MKQLEFLQTMKRSPVRNYGGIPGLTSWLIGAPSPGGLVCLMECSRDHQEPIIPHSHRFNFHCIVLAGEVRNIIWERMMRGGDEFQSTEMIYCGEMGAYKTGEKLVAYWGHTINPNVYTTGQEYSMKAHEVHSIFFAKGTTVLFFEGPTISETSIILEPFVDGEVVPTFKVEPWMFKRDESKS